MQTVHDAMTKNVKGISYAFIMVVFLLAAWLHLATPLLVAVFGMFALRRLHVFRHLPKWSAVAVFLFIAAGLLYGFAYFIREALASIPVIANKTIPAIIDWAVRHEIQLPFTDYESLKQSLLDLAQSSASVETIKGIGMLAKGASLEALFVIAGVVVAVSLFLNPQTELGRPVNAAPENFYALFCDQVSERFSLFYHSFATVMGAQMTISIINTGLTAVFVIIADLPYPIFIIGATFLCGLLPVVGNLISNTFIVAVAFTVSPTLALVSLFYLVTIHKLEYFLNSKIIGARIRNPVWLMLLALILGEKLMGIPGMILAPVILHYIKTEMSRVRLPLAETNQSVNAGP